MNLSLVLDISDAGADVVVHLMFVSMAMIAVAAFMVNLLDFDEEDDEDELE